MNRYAAFVVLAVMVASSACAAGPAPVSKIFPVSEEGAAYLIENLPNVETVGYPVGQKVKKVSEQLRAVIEVPAYIELISTTYNYSRPAPAPKVEPILRHGRPYLRYAFAPPAKDTDSWARFFTQWAPHPKDADRQGPGVFAWHFETPEGAEPEQSKPIKLLPELPPTFPPKRIIVRFWTSWNTNVAPNKLPAVLTLLQRAGVNLLGCWESRVENLQAAGAHEKGFKLAQDQSGTAGWRDLTPTGPEQYTVDNEGKVVKQQDPQYIIDRDSEPWKNDLATCSSIARRVDLMSQDIEWGPIWNTGFSRAAIAAFARQNNLDPARLTPPVIWRDYRRQWGDFRAGQMLTLASYFNKAIKSDNPVRPFIFLPGSPYTTTNPDLMSDMIVLGKDSLGRTVYLTFPFPTARMQEAFDILQPMWYMHGISQTQDAFEWSRAISARVKVPLVPLFLGQGWEYYYPGGDPGPVLRAMAWAALLGGAKGYGFWLNDFSPLQLFWLARTNREIAGVEDILIEGKPEAPDVKLAPMPKKHFILTGGGQRRSFPVPEFDKVVLQRSFASGNRRLIGLVNLDQGLDVYLNLSITNLPPGNYQVLDVSEDKIICPTPGATTFAAADLAKGFPARIPAAYGVTLLKVAPAGEPAPQTAGKQPLSDVQAAYAKYKEPDTERSTLAERAGLCIRDDFSTVAAERAILVESAKQQIRILPHSGARIAEWRIKEGNRSLVDWASMYGGAAVDLFWTPANAHWSGDERGGYDLVDAKIHGGKAYVRLRQTKTTPSLQGLVVTKTIVVPAQSADIQVKLEIENPGPAPQVGFSYWAHQMFRVGPLGSTEGKDQFPKIFMQTGEGVACAPLKSVVWAKPDQPFLPGNEGWEKNMRNGVTTGDWIAQQNPINGEAVLCQVEGPPVAQFYSDRGEEKSSPSVEWMYAYVTLEAGKTWNANYAIRYMHSVKPEDLPRHLEWIVTSHQ